MRTQHLTELELVEAVAGRTGDPRVGEHLASCLACHTEVADLQQLISQRQHQLDTLAPSWELQRQQILERLPTSSTARPTHRWLRPVLAIAAALALSLGLAVLYQHSAGAPRQPTQEEQLETILAEVDALLVQDSIPGFESLEEIVPSTDELEEYYQTNNGAS